MVKRRVRKVRKIHSRRTEGDWELTLAEDHQGWWIVIANRFVLGGHTEYVFRPARAEDARAAFDGATAANLDENWQTMDRKTTN